jgi:hypothetical protein
LCRSRSARSQSCQRWVRPPCGSEVTAPT